ncbi:MAG: glycoside hydrolase family 3 C-terminal domain-containing protein, partial [Chitinophagaceae bacterium]
AVIGPNADQWLMLLGNYNGVPSDPITPLRGIREKLSADKVIYAQGCEVAEGIPSFETVPTEALSHEGQQGLKVDYYNNRELKGNPLYSSVDANVDANWYDKSPRKDMDDDNFGVRWTGEITAVESGMYQLGMITTCKVNLYLDDSIIAKTIYNFRDEFGDPRLRKSIPIKLEAGKKYKLKVEAGESYADAQVQLVWAKPRHDSKEALKKQAIDAAMQADAVVLCMGLTARLEGEEMDINIDGFNKGDRTKLDLPIIQEQLIKEIVATGKPVILVLLNGSAVSVNWENANVPAIVEAWYPGQAAGQAIADVLFGDYNPGGKLPVTFYHSVNDLPSFSDYNLTTQTYRYFKGDPLYPFGYGLSYTSFQYDNLKINSQYKGGEDIKLSVNIKNTGTVAGDEVVQVYVSAKNMTGHIPIRSLEAFKRIHLNAGESKTVELTIRANAFSFINDDNQRKVVPGAYEVTIGGGQPDVKIKTSSNVLRSQVTIQ